MSQPRLVRTAIVAVIAVGSLLFGGTAATAATVDQTPPTAPFLNYAQGFYCLTVILGTQRSTDNVTPPEQIRYEAFDDGVFIGNLTDRGQDDGAWGVLVLTHPGDNTVMIQAIDNAGNRSAFSRAVPVHGYFTPPCTPYHF
jgi:hypothetical protein